MNKFVTGLRWTLFALVMGFAVGVSAEINKGTHLQTRGQAKVNSAMAKGYMQSGVQGVQQSQSQVNIGSKRAGTCNMVVGATQSSKGVNKEADVIVAKEIINVCK
jgi:hypothetical protein